MSKKQEPPDPQRITLELPTGWRWSQEKDGLQHRMAWFLYVHEREWGYLSANRDMTWTARTNSAGATLLNGCTMEAGVAAIVEHAKAMEVEAVLRQQEQQTMTGRFSSSKPNLQNLPRRNVFKGWG